MRAFMAHHQGMTLVSLANALLGDPMVERFHADPRVQATELLLQERVPRQAPITQPRPVEETRVTGARARARRSAASARRTRAFPHAQFLSNGNYTAVVTNAGGGASFCRGRAVTRHREDPTRDPGSQFLYLRDVRSGVVWSATFQPTLKEPEDYVVTFLPEKATFRRRDDDIATQLDIAVSTEDDVEVRRLAVTNHSDRPREIEVTSYAEIVLAPPADDLAHPAFGKLFVETEYLPESAALLCHRRPRAADEPGGLGRPRPEPRRTDRRGRWNGRPIARASWAAGAVRRTRRPSTGARSRARPASCSIPSSACASASASRPGGFVRLSFATGMAPSPGDGPGPGPEVPRPERGGADLRPRLRARAERPAAPGHLERTRPCSSSAWPRACSTPTRSLRASPELLARSTLGQEGLWPHGISGDLPILLVRVVEEDDLPLVRQVLQAQEYWRLKGLRADVVILNEHPVSYLDEMHAAAHGPPRQRSLEDVEAPAGGGLPAARRPDAGGRARPARRRGPRGPERRSGRAAEPARPA